LAFHWHASIKTENPAHFKPAIQDEGATNPPSHGFPLARFGTPQKFDKQKRMFYPIVMVRTQISSKGQTTIPSALRKKWKVAQVLWDINPDGTARVSPAPDLMSLLGSACHGRLRDPDEKKKARDAIGRKAAERGRPR